MRSAAESPGILVVGEALIDIVSRRQDERPTEHVGGSPANVALALGRLGHPVRLHTALGSDSRGQRIARYLGASGVSIDSRSWTLESTSTAHAAIGDDGTATYDFDIRWPYEFNLEPISESVLHVGSISAFLSPGGADVYSAVEQLSKAVIVSFDPNIRPELTGDRLGAIAQVEAISEKADIVKLSEDDASWLYPGLSTEAVAQHLLGCGTKVVAVTAGANGAVLASTIATVRIPSHHVQVRDTIGAGDTFSAGLIDAAVSNSSLLQSLDQDALRTLGYNAAAAAAITIQRDGAQPPTRHELAQAMHSMLHDCVPDVPDADQL